MRHTRANFRRLVLRHGVQSAVGEVKAGMLLRMYEHRVGT